MPFNHGRLSFSKEKPQFVGSPIQDIANANETLYQRAVSNQATMTKLEDFAQTLDVNTWNEPNKAEAINDLAADFDDISNNESYAYAGKNISASARRFSSNTALRESIKEKAEYDKIFAAAEKNKVDSGRINEWKNVYHRKGKQIYVDHNGVVKNKTEFENINANPQIEAQVLTVLSKMKEDKKPHDFGNGKYQYVDGQFVIVGKDASISEARVRSAIKGMVLSRDENQNYLNELKTLDQYDRYDIDDNGKYRTNEEGNFLEADINYVERLKTHEDFSDEELHTMMTDYNKEHNTVLTIDSPGIAKTIYDAQYIYRKEKSIMDNAAVIGAYENVDFDYKRNEDHILAVRHHYAKQLELEKRKSAYILADIKAGGNGDGSALADGGNKGGYGRNTKDNPARQEVSNTVTGNANMNISTIDQFLGNSNKTTKQYNAISNNVINELSNLSDLFNYTKKDGDKIVVTSKNKKVQRDDGSYAIVTIPDSYEYGVIDIDENYTPIPDAAIMKLSNNSMLNLKYLSNTINNDAATMDYVTSKIKANPDYTKDIIDDLADKYGIFKHYNDDNTYDFTTNTGRYGLTLEEAIKYAPNVLSTNDSNEELSGIISTYYKDMKSSFAVKENIWTPKGRNKTETAAKTKQALISAKNVLLQQHITPGTVLTNKLKDIATLTGEDRVKLLLTAEQQNNDGLVTAVNNMTNSELAQLYVANLDEYPPFVGFVFGNQKFILPNTQASIAYKDEDTKETAVINITLPAINYDTPNTYVPDGISPYNNKAGASGFMNLTSAQLHAATEDAIKGITNTNGSTSYVNLVPANPNLQIAIVNKGTTFELSRPDGKVIGTAPSVKIAAEMIVRATALAQTNAYTAAQESN